MRATTQAVSTSLRMLYARVTKGGPDVTRTPLGSLSWGPRTHVGHSGGKNPAQCSGGCSQAKEQS